MNMKLNAQFVKKISIISIIFLIMTGTMWMVSYYASRQNINYLLVEAVRSRNSALVIDLLSEGANPNVRFTPPNHFFENGSDEEDDDEPWSGPTVLMLAVVRADESTIKILLNHGADSTAKDKSGRSVHDWALAHPEIMYLLKERSSKNAHY